ncbi:hypothetical protein TIFTF001_028397 [Ficus carica]|uniref:Retrotransposon gag domain-containing protein n=1 Tax=Ficus carica TaxID=3494 RepID=A0AA88J1G0_FICCA|nr:hypothetical protein TIFTF001_028397 [Ficus carica]
MSRPHTRANPAPQEPDLANIVTTLQQQLREQQQETNRLREQITHLNQMPRANEVPPQDNPVPPVAPQVPEDHQGVAIEPAGIQRNPPLVRRTCCMNEQEKVLCASFALKNDTRHWWITVQMRRDVATMSWQDFVAEFRTMYYNRKILMAQQDEFNSLKQGSMSVLEAVKKFEQLARLCPELVPNETEKVRRMMKMFWTDTAKQVSAGSSPLTFVADCISRAIRAEYWINQDKEARA